MTRRIRPISEYQEHESYPSCRGDGVNRRDFLRTAVATSTLLAGATALSHNGQAAPGNRDSRERVTVYLNRQRIGTGQMAAQRLVVFTSDKKLARWLKLYSNRNGIKQALSPVLRKAHEDVLVDGKKLYRLERKLGATLVRHYRKMTGKRARQPDLMMVVGRHYRPRIMGRIRRPRFYKNNRP